MKKLEYYILKGTVDPAISGVQTISQIDDFIDPENSTRERISRYQLTDNNSFLDEAYDLRKFKLHDASKITSILTSRFLELAGLFISPQMWEVLNHFTMCKAKALPAEIFQGKISHPYFFLNILTSEDLVDFDKSVFVFDDMIEKFRTGGTQVEVKSLEEYVHYKLNPPKQFEDEVILPRKLFLKESFDLLRAPFKTSILISSSIRDRLLEQGLNDVEITKSTYEEYYLL